MTKERFCWYCGDSLGEIDSRFYEKGDTCGKSECEREARAMQREERDDAHRDLDERLGWERST
jgi:hypothetical protein